MEEPEFDIDTIARLVHLVETRGLSELTVEAEGRRVTVRGFGGGAGSTTGIMPIAAAPEDHESASEPASSWETIGAPMVGVFYRAARPDAPPFVEVGDRVEVGQTVAMIEAMKVFSEIPSDYAGVVTRIVAQNGDLVRTGEPLLYLEPEEPGYEHVTE